ncbi:MAG TPA: BolA family protein [Methylophaga sp.]|nr:BolA family protein [Methylophaga sp.]
MNTQDELNKRLQTLAPSKLEIIDESHLHAGHAGNTGGGHFNVLIVSEQFAGLMPLKRHRLVFDAVGDLMQKQIHALSIQAKTPAEFNG